MKLRTGNSSSWKAFSRLPRKRNMPRSADGEAWCVESLWARGEVVRKEGGVRPWSMMVEDSGSLGRGISTSLGARKDGKVDGWAGYIIS